MNKISYQGDVRKNKGQVMRVVLGEWEGIPYVSLETWNRAKGEAGEGEDSGKKFSLPAGVWLELLALIEAVANEGARRFGITLAGRDQRQSPQATQVYAPPYEPIDRGRGRRRQ